jgi:hypothetical protein
MLRDKTNFIFISSCIYDTAISTMNNPWSLIFCFFLETRLGKFLRKFNYNVWMNEWLTNEWMNEWMNEQTNE